MWNNNRSLMVVVVVCLLASSGCDRQQIVETQSDKNPVFVDPTVDRPTPILDGPVAEFQELDVDLGEIEITSIKTKATATISVRNTGDAELIVHRMSVSCGCTQVSPPQKPIAPGESVDILVGVTISRSGKEAARVTVFSNSVASPETTIRILWDAIAPIEVVPAEILLGDIEMGKTATGTVALQLSKFKTCPITQIELQPLPPNSVLTARLDEAGAVQVSLPETDEPGDYVEYVVLTLRDCWRDSIRIPVRWRVVTRYTVAPKIVYAGQVEPGQEITQTILISGPEKELVNNVTSVAVIPSEANPVLKWEPIDASRGKLMVKLKAPESSGAFHIRITLRVSGDENDDVEATISGYVVSNQ